MLRIMSVILIISLHSPGKIYAMESTQKCKDLKKNISLLENELDSLKDFSGYAFLADPKYTLWHPIGTPGMLLTNPAIYAGIYFSEFVEKKGVNENLANKSGQLISLSLLVPALPLAYGLNLSCIPIAAIVGLAKFIKIRSELSELRQDYSLKCDQFETENLQGVGM